MKSLPIAFLTDVAILERGTEPGSSSYCESKNGIRFLRVGDISRKVDQTVFTNGKSLTLVEEHDVLLALDGSPGCVARGFVGAISSGIRKVRPKDSKILLRDYLFYALQTSTVQDVIKRNTRGITIAHASSALSYIKIPLPPLAEQERIVRLLDEADGMQRLRRQANKRMKEFVPALFDEMFGNPGVNERGWRVVPITELSNKFSDGPFGSNLKTSHYTDIGIRVVRLQNIGVGNFVDADKAFISEKHFSLLKKHECVPGDVLVGTLGDPNLRACVLPASIEIALNKADCIQIRPNPKIATAEYICWLLNMPSTLEMASGLIQGQTRARISMGRLRELYVPLPPLALQHEFTARVGEAQAVLVAQERSTEQVEALFESMLGRAFAGEL